MFYHPDQIEESGVVRFNTDLIKVKIVVGHAEKLFRDAIECIQSECPDKDAECEWCGWEH